jgi:hypothetical protein
MLDTGRDAGPEVKHDNGSLRLKKGANKVGDFLFSLDEQPQSQKVRKTPSRVNVRKNDLFSHLRPLVVISDDDLQREITCWADCARPA